MLDWYYLHEIINIFNVSDDGNFNGTTWAGGGNFSEFKKFRDWYNVHGKRLSKYGQSKSSAGLSGWEFRSFDELRDSIKSLAQNIKGRDDST
jgi:hypothetical protein